MTNLADEHCVALTKSSRRVDDGDTAKLLKALPEWRVVTEAGIERLDRQFSVHNFARALELTNAIGAAAEREDHHPAILTEWGRVKVSWWTHSVHGLHRNDFIMAARTDRLYALAAS